MRSETEGRYVSVFFDGTTCYGEALAIVIWFIMDWKIEQCLVRLLMLAKPVTENELVREILTVLSTELGVASTHLLACMRYRASVNSKAMNSVPIMYTNLMDIGCFSHALDTCGIKFNTPTLDKFMKHWFHIFRHSCKAKFIWHEITGQMLKHYSSTRWWNKWECQKQILLPWEDVVAFIENADVATKKSRKAQVHSFE